MAKKAEKIAQQARDACERWNDYFKRNITEYHEKHNFVLGRQWDDEEEEVLINGKKIPLQFNKLPPLINSLLGEQLQNTPQLTVVPMENSNEETAHIRELITKDIMFSSNTKLVYQIAASQAAIGGYGAFALEADYIHEESFEQEAKYTYFNNATQCYWDVGAQTVNKIDGMMCGWLSRMTREKFSQTYGKNIEEKILKDTSPAATEEKDGSFDWADENSVTINDYFVRKLKKVTLYKLSNGNTYTQEQMDEIIERSQQINRNLQQAQVMAEELAPQMATTPEMQEEEVGAINELPEGEVVEGIATEEASTAPIPITEEFAAETSEELAVDEDIVTFDEDIVTLWDEGEIVRIEQTKEIQRSIIHHYKIGGDYILEDSEFPGVDLPLVFMDQQSYYNKKGEQICRPFIVDAVDAQKYYNYLKTQSAYLLKVSRYDQWIGSKKNVASVDTQQKWKDPLNVQGLLTYDESPSGARPEQVRPPELSLSLSAQAEATMEDLYTSTGLYPTRLGDQGPENSGVAINARARQGSYPVQIFFTSVNRAIEAGGEVLNGMIPRVYDTERVMSLMTSDGQRNITVNQQMDEYGATIKNDLRKGTYQVRLEPGPSYEGQKTQALDSFNMILQANPQLLNLFADLYAENLPLANTIEIKNRLKTIVPPEIIEAGKTGQSPPPQPPQPDPMEQAVQVEAQKNQMKAENDQLKAQIEMQKLEMEGQELEQRMEIERLKLAARIEEQKLKYRAETERTQSREEIANADNLVKILTSKMQ